MTGEARSAATSPGRTVTDGPTTAPEAVAGHDAGGALRALGGAATGPRRAIVDALLSAERLRTPEQLLAEARVTSPSTSLATVYRTIERLDAAGRVKRATLASGAVGYAYCDVGHHEHAICVRCGRVERVDPCLAAAWQAPRGFRATSHVLDFFGTCERCSAALAEGTDAPA